MSVIWQYVHCLIKNVLIYAMSETEKQLILS